jgi:hypothetical protein
MWPLEAKVLRSDGAVAPYVKDIQNEFLTCRYAPFSSEGGMLGYLLSGTPSKVFSSIEAKVHCPLTHHLKFPERDHKISNHKRTVPAGKPYPAVFRCHHLLLQITGEVYRAKQALPGDFHKPIPANAVGGGQNSSPQ